MNDPYSVAVYARKSKFTGKGESIENQTEMCKQYIRMHYPDISDERIITYEDEGYSGKSIKRPQFSLMMQDCRQHKFKTIVCYRFDRISRNIKDFADLIQELENLQISFISIKENFDTASPMGRAMMYISSVFSQLERETIAERIKDNMYELAKTGRWLGGVAPTGYRSTETVGSVTSDGKTRKAFKLEIIDEEADIVKEIFDKFIETESLTKTQEYLRERRIKTKNGREFTRFAVRNILSNPVYSKADEKAWEYFSSLEGEIYAGKGDFDGEYGIMAYGKTAQSAGKTNRIKDVREWIITVGKHEGLISGDKWTKVQKMLEHNRLKSYRKPRSNAALLSGLLFCGECGAFMRPKLSGRSNGEGKRIYDYLCETKEKTKGSECEIKRINGNDLDFSVCVQIKNMAEAAGCLSYSLEKVKETIETAGTEEHRQVNCLKARERELEKKIKTLVDALSESEETAAFAYYSERINFLISEKEDTKARREEKERNFEAELLSCEKLEKTENMLMDFSSVFNTMSVKQKRKALGSIIEKVIWDGESVHIYFSVKSDEIKP